MRNKYPLKRIRNRRYYTLSEVAELMDAGLRTVQQWHYDGLQVLDESTRPLLIEGLALKTFLKARIDKYKVKLKSGQCYCLGCKKAVKPLNPIIKEYTKPGGSISVAFEGPCPHCKKQVFRFDKKETLEPMLAPENTIKKVTEPPTKKVLKHPKKQEESYESLPLFGGFT